MGPLKRAQLQMESIVDQQSTALSDSIIHDWLGVRHVISAVSTGDVAGIRNLTDMELAIVLAMANIGLTRMMGRIADHFETGAN